MDYFFAGLFLLDVVLNLLLQLLEVLLLILLYGHHKLLRLLGLRRLQAELRGELLQFRGLSKQIRKQST